MSTVLIVDDSPADRALFHTMLSRAGFGVHEAARGRDALDRAREVRPHLVVLDVNLPDISGHDVCRALKAGADTCGLPVLMLTVRDNDADVIAGLEAGADDYVAKDSAPAIVLARVRRLIEFRRLATLAVLNEHLVQVGRLLAGIVHEIRGPLSVIRGSAELMRMQLGDTDDAVQWVDPILRNARLLQVRLEHLMAAVRGGPGEVQTVEPGPLVLESADLFVKGTDPRGTKIKVNVHCDDALPYVQVDAGRFIQIILSLLGNAHEAIVGAGAGRHIEVRTALTVCDGVEWVTIDVADDGPGIPEPYLERIFEPFFTTKEKGSGYGLYMALEMVKEQRGRLTVRNATDSGAVFTVWLPVVPTLSPAAASTT
jgi:signal transduction histidine kinase